ncbi:MAG: hypothetical protein SVZ03_05575 [Spirochaetota bacterium]|nr:hypothetical protein [Spirochaetota bacterium]
MVFCSKCVLPETFPGINFEEKGICNYCLHTPIPDEGKKKDYLNEFEDLLNSKKGKNDYDAIVAYSGGKDSTYTLHFLISKYGLNVLAWTFDNGFLSDQAKINIINMTDKIGATSMIVRPPFDIMKKAFRFAAINDIYSAKTLDRASSICTTCIGLVKALVLKTALHMNIPLVAYGWSPGQAPISSAIMQTSPRLQRMTHKTIKEPFLKQVGPELSTYFVTDAELDIDKERWPKNIHPLAFVDYNEEEILKVIQSLGWKKPSDTDPNSTNCLLNALANYLHKKRFGFHPYAWEIAGIVRGGNMHREEGIIKTNQEEDMNMVKYAADKLNIEISD